MEESDLQRQEVDNLSANGVSDGSFDPGATETQMAAAAYFWSAPLPRPEVLAKYNEAFSDCAERIVAMAERQAAHRQSLEATVIRSNTRSQTTGLWLGFILALIVVGSGAWLVHEGRVEWGAGFIGVPLVALVSVFVYGKQDQKKQLQKNEPETAQQKLPFPE